MQIDLGSGAVSSFASLSALVEIACQSDLDEFENVDAQRNCPVQGAVGPEGGKAKVRISFKERLI